jgi:SAM-dependent methyltransferase
MDFRLVFQPIVRSASKYLEGGLIGKRALDVGCGLFFPQTLLLHSIGCNVTGIDTFLIVPSSNIFHRLRIINNVPVGEFLYRLGSEIPMVPEYYRSLAKLAHFPLRFRNLDIRRCAIEQAPQVFGSDTFDLIISNVTLEHMENLDQVCQCMEYVLKPKGIMRHTIHLFPSLTGGHNIPYGSDKLVALGDVPPWDHIRERRFPATVRLNELRERDYRRIFERWFKVLEWNDEIFEPRSVLTHELRAELRDYSEEELLKRNITVILGKQ